MCKVVNLRNSEFDVYIGRGRGGCWGNPFVIGKDGSREEVVEKYRAWFAERVESDSTFKEQLAQLKGKTLGCYCKPLACHGDVIAEYVNALEQDEAREELRSRGFDPCDDNPFLFPVSW
jgi:hypothetical protein